MLDTQTLFMRTTITDMIFSKDHCTNQKNGTVLELNLLFHIVKIDQENIVHTLKMFMFIVQIDFIYKLYAFY
jgi:hypothetical protein